MTLSPHLLRSTWLFAAVAGLSSCLSLEKAAPPVEQLRGKEGVAERFKLAQGREIYITRCAKCHSVEPVTKYSVQHWEEVLPEMAEKTHLTAVEAESVRAYVLQVLRSGPAPEVLRQDKPQGKL